MVPSSVPFRQAWGSAHGFFSNLRERIIPIIRRDEVRAQFKIGLVLLGISMSFVFFGYVLKEVGISQKLSSINIVDDYSQRVYSTTPESFETFVVTDELAEIREWATTTSKILRHAKLGERLGLVDPFNPNSGWQTVSMKNGSFGFIKTSSGMSYKQLEQTPVKLISHSMRQEGGNLIVSGNVVNLSNLPRIFVGIEIEFFDEFLESVLKGQTMVGVASAIGPNEVVPFSVSIRKKKSIEGYDCRLINMGRPYTRAVTQKENIARK